MSFTRYSIVILLFALMSCSNPSPIHDPVPAHDSLNIQSNILGEKRIINIWTPQYYKDSQDSLPVLYMLDGGIKEDFPHIANTLSELIALKQIPPIILVGIENTQRRKDLTGFTEVEKDKEIAPFVGGSATFRRFIKDELFPEI